ncbi:Uncharacterised protein [Chromobacterium violaceum]|uniref:Uncharacterized protein n=1 Tax=Chromobacterium violaceum TaxID=536 RepID=A0A3S5DLZ5_CHRVL|nr:Uncharacterised protein [Chromobacterium violaceum]
MGKDYHVPHGHQLQLLLAAGTVEHGGGSTSLLLYLSVQELNQLTHDMLERSRYQHAYLHLQLGSGLYEWTRRDGWREIHTPAWTARWKRRCARPDVRTRSRFSRKALKPASCRSCRRPSPADAPR